MSAALAAAPAATAPAPIRVMVVDDSVVVRGLVARWLAEEPDLKVVASLRTGADAVEQVARTDPDVVILDIEMPELDGLAALPLLLQKKRDLVVVMASLLTRRQAEVSLKALSLGAADYVPKPHSNRGVTTSPEFRRELIDKIRQLGRRRQRGAGTPASTDAGAASHARKEVEPAHPAFKLRPWSRHVPRVLLIGSSTGGPQALTAMLSRLGRVAERMPVLIAQHMPPTFTTILAEHLTRALGRPVHEAQEGQTIAAGKVYVAPGGRHMLAASRNGEPTIRLDDGAPINFCKPAVDPLFASAVEVWGSSVLAVILTGMGSDGARGAESIVAAGGNVIAQDEASSVVWGMPGTAAQAGLCAAVLPLDAIPLRITSLLAGDFS